MQTEAVNIGKVIPYARNPRRNDAAISKVAASLQEFGWQQPIVVDADMVVVAGHTRLEAARSLGMTEVPVHVAAGLTPEQVKAYRIADNRVGQEAEWDEELLRLELGELESLEFPLDLTGFDADELEGINPQAIDEFPALPDGDREPYQQITFNLHDEQAEQVMAAIKEAQDMGPFVGVINENKNGNAIARVCEIFVTQNAKS